ncbi:30S ribosomal protein S6 [Irregularibacter muris]|jgi:small subunit ribosomal protein S6|uniref:Small ribosomal subunit protein bS6 n=1 Tax=Irregularibacter muris TaxID=1796619 RepID=A0AAE3L416_9FIRM|nr:30S ribosomal protein S6 [Irregularibacter muris]MCR1899268.1 30S ribosomal protein S6 [Irregularibacter muris]
MNKYETIFIIRPEAEEELVQSLIEKTTGIIETNGSVESIDQWGKRKLAYEVKGFKEGYYVLMNYTADPAIPAELDRVFKITEDIIRHIIIKEEE